VGSKARLIFAAVKTALQAANGADPYTYDLSSAGRVVMRRPRMEDTQSPVVYAMLEGFDSEGAPTIGEYRRNLILHIEGRVSPGTQDPEERALSALDLLNDIMQALQSDRSLGNLVLDIIVSGTTLDGDEVGLTNFGIVYAMATMHWDALSTEGA